MPIAVRGLASILLAGAVLSTTVDRAGADNLFQMLFGGGLKRTTVAPAPPAARPARKPVRAAPALPATSEEYFTYRPDPVARIDFAPLIEGQPVVLPAAYSPAGKPDFLAAVAGLQDYRLLAEPAIGKAVTAYYVVHQGFLWVDSLGPNERAKAAMAVLANAGAQALDPADYAVPLAQDASPEAAMRFEMALSARLLRYVHDASEGRIDPNRISGYYDFPRKPIDYGAELAALAEGGDIAAYLREKLPGSKEYAALSAEYGSLRGQAAEGVTIDRTLVLKPGQDSPELPKLLALVARDLDDDLGGTYGALLWRERNAETYGPELVPLFKALQTRAGLAPDGVLGPRTIKALAGDPASDRLAKLAYALEAMRWLPHELGATRVVVNQPAFTASFIADGIETLKMRVVVGARATQTSFFYDEIEQVDFNPYWGVPQSILVKEMLPRLRRDPGYLDRAGYEVHDARGRRVPSRSVAWGQFGTRIPYDVRQIPSEANALGELKILFPNEHAIYMHDTPSKELFKRDVRAFSHGCIRLQDPRGMAAAVLGTTVDAVKAKLAQGHSSERVPTPIPVYIAYFTAWPNAAGAVEYFDDVYGRDSYLARAIEATRKARAGS